MTQPVSYRSVLTSRNVPQLLLAASLFRLGHAMMLFAVVLYAIAQFDSAAVAGLSGFFLTFPGFVVSPVAGAILDRFGAVRAVALDGVGSAVCIGAIGISSLSGVLTPALLFLLLALYSLTSPLTDGGIRTLFPQFVPEAAYDKANALDLSTYSVIEVAGPLAAGALFAAAGPDPTLMTIAAMYAMAGFSLALLRGGSRPAAPGGGTERHLLQAAWDGIRYLARNATLRALAVSYSVFQVAYGMLIVVVPVAVERWFADGDSAGRLAGAMWSVAGLFGGLGALLAGKMLHAGVERRYMAGATVVAALAVFPLSALGSLIALGAGLAVFGMAEGTVNVSLLSLRQRRTDPGWLGRIMTVSISVNLIGFPVGTALGGFLAGAVSLRTTFAVAAALTLVSAGCARLLIPREA
ncbi:putative MFS-type transporter y4rN [Streptomyces mashuensis]|uniref:MFS-type transporter y4rN n=1 Tax=Streptomyces mashuensis TaxID=33904 RepID=A0A919ECV2_9ACTN|nr:MFS transporter [Streptomyces mashuensis]GHF52448.1 putative MFS-type transporter y4rN [Streptomyces mashuensis]